VPRYSQIDPVFDEESRRIVEHAMKTGAPSRELYTVLAHRPDLMKAFAYAWNTAFYQGRVDHRVKELVRLAMVNVHSCGYCSNVRSQVAREMGLTEEKIRELHRFEESSLFTPKEKAAIRYALKFSTDLNAAKDDEAYEELKRYFPEEEERLELEFFIALTEGFGKLVSTLGILPESCELPAGQEQQAEGG